MRIIIFLSCVIGSVCVLLLFSCLHKKKYGGRAVLSAAAAMICIGVVIIYFVPARISLPSEYDDVEIRVFTDSGVYAVEDEPSKKELVELVGTLTVRRRLLSEYFPQIMRFDASEYVKLHITFHFSSGSTEREILTLTMNPSGFTYSRGYGFDRNYNELIHTGALISYLKEALSQEIFTPITELT